MVWVSNTQDAVLNFRLVSIETTVSSFQSLDYDDNNGYACNQGKYPLLSKVYDLLWNETTMCTTTTKTTTLGVESTTNRSKLITPMWKRSSKFFFKDYRGRIGANKPSSSYVLSSNPLFNILQIIFMLCSSAASVALFG